MADRAQGIPVAKEGLLFILSGAALTLGAWSLGGVWSTCFLGTLTLFTTWFFRNPSREIPKDEHVVVSPGDGVVVAIESEFESRYLKEDSIRVSIFLNVFDVHINRMPIAGTVQDIVYQPGKFMTANSPQASSANEQNALMLCRSDGAKVLCVQIAGLIARRIVSWVVPGEKVEKGERFGLIRFGSRMDVYLPQASTVRVQVGSRVKGGSSILAEVICADPS